MLQSARHVRKVCHFTLPCEDAVATGYGIVTDQSTSKGGMNYQLFLVSDDHSVGRLHQVV